jgi:hypothetical protein
MQCMVMIVHSESIKTHSLCEDVDSAPHPADRGKCNKCRRGDHVTAREEMR